MNALFSTLNPVTQLNKMLYGMLLGRFVKTEVDSG